MDERWRSSTSDNFRRENFRLSSFQRFPASVPIDARKFAAAGFYYTGKFDEVKCFACSNLLRNISSLTDPFLLSMHKSSCGFARGQNNCGNITLDFASAPTTLLLESSSPHSGSATRSLSENSASRQHISVTTPPSLLNNNASNPRITLTGSYNAGPIRYYQGLDIRNFPTARPAAPPVPTYDVPIYRQLATIQNPDQARLIRSLNLCRESHRFQTFTADWSSDSAPPAQDMAASGWFFLGNLDRTQCFCCGGVLRNWRRLDNPNTEHITHFPHCLMAQGHESRNIPDTDRQGLHSPTSPLIEFTEQQRADLRNMFPCLVPATPAMQSVENRLRTFVNWHFTRVTPQMHAAAGFFSLVLVRAALKCAFRMLASISVLTHTPVGEDSTKGVRDRVKCFYCNGGLQNWRQNDNPLEEHAKWYPTCEFLLQQKGPEFIHNIVARFPNINRRRVLNRPESSPMKPPTPPLPSQFRDAQTQQPQLVQERTLDPLEVAMDSEVTTAVIEMGFDTLLVRDVTQRNIDQNGTGYDSAAALLEAVIDEQRAREPDEIAREQEPSLNSRSPAPYFREGMDEEENLDFCRYGLIAGSIDVAESGFSASSPLFDHNVNHSNSKASVCEVNPTEQQKQLPAFTEETEEKEALKKKLKQKLQQLKDERVCKVCLDLEADMVFITCGHICCCLECTKSLKTCPICRKKIEKAVRTYTS